MKKKTHFSFLIARNVTKHFYQADRTLRVLEGVSITCKQGDSCAITGASGSGKSTLLHILGGLEEPTTGSVDYNDKSILQYKDREKALFLNRDLGFVFQFHYLVNELTVIENIMLPGLISGREHFECQKRARSLLRDLDLLQKQDAYPYELSGGQQQRVSIMRALFNKPSFILADEPTGNLDAHNAQEVINFFMRCQQEWGLGLIICSHDPAVSSKMEIVYTLNEGRLVVAKQ